MNKTRLFSHETRKCKHVTAVRISNNDLSNCH